MKQGKEERVQIITWERKEVMLQVMLDGQGYIPVLINPLMSCLKTEKRDKR